MPLLVSPAPAPALRSVLAALGSPTAVREAHTPALRSVQGPLSLELPLPVHVLDRIVPTEAVPTTRLAGWRFLVRDGERTVAAADSVLTADGWTFSHFFEGPYLASTELAVSQAESATTPYQARLLSVPELYMLTLWLHEDTEDDAAGGALAPTDVLVPLSPAPTGITAHRPHRVAALLPVMSLRVGPPRLPGLPGVSGLLGSPA
ncbi:hypothetical protein [Streptomyces sp. NRRL WC-3549]|uniref:hypothetical protein n=1 Tax=Streptomyces sp. NRRL WC-3549 TaxID=1463925 RepID=UPI0004C9307E|nr:hypothetical protein [Streptomyces sp. NRRL WC-3549]